MEVSHTSFKLPIFVLNTNYILFKIQIGVGHFSPFFLMTEADLNKILPTTFVSIKDFYKIFLFQAKVTEPHHTLILIFSTINMYRISQMCYLLRLTNVSKH